MKTHRIANKLLSMALCIVMLLGLCAAFTLVKPQSVVNAAEPTSPRQVSQWTGSLSLSQMETIYEVETKGYAWYKEATTGTPYGDLQANTLVLDGLNLLSDNNIAISFVLNSSDTTEIELNIILAEGSKNTVAINRYDSTCIYIAHNKAKISTLIKGNGILELKCLSEVSYGKGLYATGQVTQEDGDIRLDIQGKVQLFGVFASLDYFLNNGKLSVQLGNNYNDATNYPIYKIAMESDSFIKEPAGLKYVMKGGYKTILKSDDKYPQKVVLEAVKADKYTAIYDANGATSGTAPIDSTKYAKNDFAITKDKGDLAKTGYTFVGWTSEPDGSGVMSPGDSIVMDRNITLYAKWVPETPSTITPTITGFSAIRTSESTATIKFTTNVDGGYYIIIVDKGTPRPNNPGDNDWTACSAGEQTIRFNYLTAGEKDIYIFIKGNSTEVVEIETISADVEKDDDKLSAGVIVVIALSASLGLLLILIVLYILWKYGILKGKAANTLIGWLDPAAVKICKIFCKKDKLFTVKGTKGEQ